MPVLRDARQPRLPDRRRASPRDRLPPCSTTARVIDLYGERVLLMHGDALCTDDVELPQRSAAHGAQPGCVKLDPRATPDRRARRRSCATAARAAASTSTATSSREIMDVNAGAVEAGVAHGTACAR
ncbi:MAG: hypothetical protein MZV65_34160 [Chromatiales bacterium]|nr:hypothetical protein [Chromatiales bacterium]